MPQASYEQHLIMAKWFGSPVDDRGPATFLFVRGWTEAKGMWSKPTPSHNPSAYEVECLLFLRDEWDYDWNEPLFQPLPSKGIRT